MASPSRLQTLTVGSQTLSAAIFTTGKDGSLMLDKFVMRSLTGEPTADAARADQTGFLLEELARASEVKVPARYTVSGQSVFTRFVKLPPMGDNKVDQIVEFEAQQNVPFPIAEVIWDYQLFTDAASGDTEVALVAIKADMLNQINTQVEDAGFRAETVDVAPMALLNAFRFNYPDIKEPSLLIDIGARTTNLVFSEPGRIFARSLPIGGAAVTSAVAKEFQVSFDIAEEKKRRDAFVALGGAYAEHSDPNLAAMARVARSVMTRLHAEVVRTVNYYRSTLGGNQPRLAFLCGGGAAMPYTKEFFEEKLGMHVEYFNALRNIAVSQSVAETANAASFRLGEHVGLALRAVSSCPVEIDLEPDAVALRRETRERKPLWIAAALCLLAGTGAMAAHGYFASDKAVGKQSTLTSESAKLTTLSRSITQVFEAGDRVDKERQFMLAALEQRQRWPELLATLNGYFASDVLWVTDVDPLVDTESVFADLSKDAKGATRPAPDAEKPGGRGDDKGAKATREITAIRIRGLWRSTLDNPNAGQDQVRVVFERIRADKQSPFQTDKLEIGKNSRITGFDEAYYARSFEMTLPLAKPFPLD